MQLLNHENRKQKSKFIEENLENHNKKNACQKIKKKNAWGKK